MSQETSAGVQEAQLQRLIPAIQRHVDPAAVPDVSRCLNQALQQPTTAASTKAWADPRGRSAPLAAGRSIRILLVEDDDDGAKVLGRLLTSIGHAVTIAPTCAAARDAGQAEFDLLLGDLALPDGSGLELVAQLKHQRPSVKAIALTGYGDAGDVAASLAAGFDAHLTKPITLEQLVAAINRLCS